MINHSWLGFSAFTRIAHIKVEYDFDSIVKCVFRLISVFSMHMWDYFTILYVKNTITPFICQRKAAILGHTSLLVFVGTNTLVVQKDDNPGA